MEQIEEVEEGKGEGRRKGKEKVWIGVRLSSVEMQKCKNEGVGIDGARRKKRNVPVDRGGEADR